jgi:hypothetical protein
MAQSAIVSDTTPALVQAGLLSALRSVLNCEQASECDVSLVLQIVLRVANTAYGARSIVSDEGLYQPVFTAALAAISNWSSLQPQLRADTEASTLEAAIMRAETISEVTRAVLIVAQLLEAGTYFDDCTHSKFATLMKLYTCTSIHEHNRQTCCLLQLVLMLRCCCHALYT